MNQNLQYLKIDKSLIGKEVKLKYNKVSIISHSSVNNYMPILEYLFNKKLYILDIDENYYTRTDRFIYPILVGTKNKVKANFDTEKTIENFIGWVGLDNLIFLNNTNF